MPRFLCFDVGQSRDWIKETCSIFSSISVIFWILNDFRCIKKSPNIGRFDSVVPQNWLRSRFAFTVYVVCRKNQPIYLPAVMRVQKWQSLNRYFQSWIHWDSIFYPKKHETSVSIFFVFCRPDSQSHIVTDCNFSHISAHRFFHSHAFFLRYQRSFKLQLYLLIIARTAVRICAISMNGTEER